MLEIAKEFDNNGYNLVYDEVLHYGENWEKMVSKMINSANCKGVIFLLTEHSLISKYVCQEVEMTIKANKSFIPMFYNGVKISEVKVDLNALSQEQKEIYEKMQGLFSEKQLGITKADINWDKVKDTFDSWDFIQDGQSIKDLIPVGYSTSLTGENIRLDNQSQGYYEFDMKAINEVLSSFKKDNLCVVDLGCSSGSVTFSRFANSSKIKKVIGVDFNERDIAIANEKAKLYGDKFSFYCLNLENEDACEQLLSILQENGYEKADIVFSALVLHHLKSPQEVITWVYDILDADCGKIILRGSDDGGKMCYPDNDLLHEILDRYSRVMNFNSTDRHNARKLYSFLKNSYYLNIKMLYNVTDTIGKDRNFKKECLFDIAFGFRLKRLDAVLKQNPYNKELKEERDWLQKSLKKLEKSFLNTDFYYCVTSYIAIASVGAGEDL